MPNFIGQNYQWLIVLFSGIYIFNAYPELSKIFLGDNQTKPTADDTASIDTAGPNKIFTKNELAKYNGEKSSIGLYLAILGTVYDVEKGRKHYGPGCTYGYFAGKK